MAFDKSKHVIRVQGGREYLPVSARLVWFREEHPDWSIVTSPVEINLEKQYAIFSASILNAEGRVMATATKMENVRGFGDYLEKAETGSVGRALAYCGYGTQFEPGLDEGDRFADAPAQGGFGNANNRFAPAASGGNNRGGFNGNNGGPAGNRFGGNNMPGPPPPAARNVERPAAAPPRPAPAPARDDEDFGGSDDEDGPGFDENDAPPPVNAANRVAERPAAPAPARPAAPPQQRPAVAPARPAPAPAAQHDDDEDDEDPFADLDDPAPARPIAAPPAVRTAAAARAAVAAQQNDSGENVLTSNRCSEDGCPVMLTPGQVKLSTAKFGRPLCPRHQKDAVPVAGGAGRPAGADALL